MRGRCSGGRHARMRRPPRKVGKARLGLHTSSVAPSLSTVCSSLIRFFRSPLESRAGEEEEVAQGHEEPYAEEEAEEAAPPEERANEGRVRRRTCVEGPVGEAERVHDLVRHKPAVPAATPMLGRCSRRTVPATTPSA